jgi:hypothetical protein
MIKTRKIRSNKILNQKVTEQKGKKERGLGERPANLLRKCGVKIFARSPIPRRRRGQGGKRLVLASARKQSPQKLFP